MVDTRGDTEWLVQEIEEAGSWATDPISGFVNSWRVSGKYRKLGGYSARTNAPPPWSTVLW